MICATPTLLELVHLYVRGRPGIKPGTVGQLFYAVKSLQRYHGCTLRAADFEDDLILAWLSHRLAEWAPKTVHRERSSLLTLWRFAYKKGYAQSMPIDIPSVRLPRKNPNSWTIEEYTRLIATCKSLTGKMRETEISRAVWWESLLVFLYWIGCRIGAALAIQPGDVDLSRRLVRLDWDDAKTSLEQILVMHPEAVNAVSMVLSPGREFLWPYPYHRSRIWRHYKAILVQAGLPTDRKHMFQKVRRTTYTQCVKHGSKDIASRQLGHKTDMSRYYLDVTQLPDTQAADVMPPLNPPAAGLCRDW